jgi:hypothetical protein
VTAASGPFIDESADPRVVPVPLLGVCGLLLGIGVLTFLFGLASDPVTTWRAFHVNFIYFATLSQAGLCVSCALVIIGAHWAGPLRHVSEGLAAWVPVTLVLFLIGFLGRDVIFAPWIEGAAAVGKEGWLNVPRVYITNLIVLFVLTVLSLVYLRASFRPALQGAAERAPRAQGMFQRWTAGWRGDAAEREASQRLMGRLAPIICLLYAFGYTLIGYDQVMALLPSWYSNMFGWYFGWGGFLNAVSLTALICVLLRATQPGWDREVTRERMHDLGKMVFAFSIFWMYIFFAQYIVIWYGNLPEETQFLEARIGSQFMQDTWRFAASRLDEPYVGLSLTAWVLIWVIPFWVLLGQRPKRTPAILGTVAAGSVIGFWLERNALIWPSYVPADGSAWLGPIQIGVAAGFFGAFALVFLVFSRIFPTLPLPRHD